MILNIATIKIVIMLFWLKEIEIFGANFNYFKTLNLITEIIQGRIRT